MPRARRRGRGEWTLTLVRDASLALARRVNLLQNRPASRGGVGRDGGLVRTRLVAPFIHKRRREKLPKSLSHAESWSVHNPPTVEITRGGRGRALTCCRGGREWRDARGRAPTRRLAPRCILLRTRGGATSVSAEAEGEGPRAKKQRRVTRGEKTREDDDVNVPPCDATRYPRRSSREMPGKSRRASRDVRVTRGKKPRVSTGASGAVRRGARAAGKRVTGLFFPRLVWSTHLCSASPPR